MGAGEDAERDAARLVAAGAVGASVAHELRNALAVAESALFLAQRDLDDRARLVRHLEQVGHEIRRAHAVVGSVLGLARGEPVRCEPVHVGSLVEAARHALVLPTHV
ncbi:MAG TPA: histidine kinase dimerization/phospho-acceptor domain-containing protein, partial [Byssovorax sp.]